jgi:protein TonB
MSRTSLPPRHIVLAGVAVLSLLPAVVRAEPPPEPVDATKAVRGSCAKGELSTARGCLISPEIIKASKVFPKYPEAARRLHIQATVKVIATIEVDGTISHVDVSESSAPGYGFEEACLEANRKWRYKPGSIAGQPVRVLFLITTTFTIDP